VESPFRQPTPRERQRDWTRARLFDAALEEFRREGFARASVSRIARRAGVSRASFYFHFPTKDHVLLELQWNLELRLVGHLSGAESLRSALQRFVEGLTEAERSVGDLELFRDMIRIYTRLPDGLALDDQPFPLVLELGRHFLAGARRGELRSGLEAAQATHLFLTSVFGYLIGTRVSVEALRADFEVLISLYLEDARP
jgi:AcrR family transcriptional regulator